MIPKRLSFLFLLLLNSWLVACTNSTNTEPTLILPTPITNNEENTAVIPTAIIPIVTPAETSAEPTPTLIPTVTPTAKPVTAAETDPSVQSISSPPLPAANRDLLFLADGAFKMWNHTSGQIETIVAGADSANRTIDPLAPAESFVGDITSFAMSADGKRAVVARLLAEETVTRSSGPNSNSYEDKEFAYALIFVDMISREIWTLVPQVDNLAGFQLSPDAQQLAFIATGLDGIPETSPNEQPPNNLYVLTTGGGNPGRVRQIYACQPFCITPKWHVESNLVAFADNVGLWLYNIAANAPEQLLENQGFTLDITDINQISVYSPIDWANNGRYLLLWRGGWEGGSRAVLDVPTGVLAAVPDSFVYAGPFSTEVSWLPDDRLLILRTEMGTSSTTPMMELWRVDLTAGQIVLDESTLLSDQSVGAVNGTYLEDGRFAFALSPSPVGIETPATIQAATGTYLLTSLNDIPEKVNRLPSINQFPISTTALWANDGSGALLRQEPRVYQPVIFYAPTNGEVLYEITAVLGQYPHDFQWQPEIIVP